jgi:hypothetical protein
MTIQAIQNKLYQNGYNWEYTWTGEIKVFRPLGRHNIYPTWNKVKENLTDLFKYGIYKL